MRAKTCRIARLTLPAALALSGCESCEPPARSSGGSSNEAAPEPAAAPEPTEENEQETEHEDAAKADAEASLAERMAAEGPKLRDVESPRFGIHGPVRVITDQYGKVLTEFDCAGNLIEHSDTRTIWVFDEAGCPSTATFETQLTHGAGRLVGRIEADCDKSGRIVRKRVFVGDELISESHLRYDEAGREAWRLELDGSGATREIHETKYDEAGREVWGLALDGSGATREIHETKYNDKGDVVWEKIDGAGGWERTTEYAYLDDGSKVATTKAHTNNDHDTRVTYGPHGYPTRSEVLIDGEVVRWTDASFEIDEQGNWTKLTETRSDGSEYVSTRTIEYCPEQAD